MRLTPLTKAMIGVGAAGAAYVLVQKTRHSSTREVATGAEIHGFVHPNRGFPYGSPSSFGHPGAGGSLGFADPDARAGYGYIPNRKSVAMGGDPRDVALRHSLYSATPIARGRQKR